MSVLLRAFATAAVASLPFLTGTGCGPADSGDGTPTLGTVAESYTILPCSSFSTTPYPPGDYVEGYVDKQSYLPSDTVHVFASARFQLAPALVNAKLFLLRTTHPLSVAGLGSNLLTPAFQTIIADSPIPSNASHCGARFPEATGLAIPLSTILGASPVSGIYVVELSLAATEPIPVPVDGASFSHRAWIPLVVRAADPSSASMLVVSATNTANAYNSWPRPTPPMASSVTEFNPITTPLYSSWAGNGIGLAGHSYYTPVDPSPPSVAADWLGVAGGSGPNGNSTCASFFGTAGDISDYPVNCASQAGKTANFLRPSYNDPGLDIQLDPVVNFALVYERELLDWLSQPQQGFSFSVAADSDDAVVAALDPTRVNTVVFAGHSEYWTGSMASAVQAYLLRGGHVWDASGNTANWQVDYVGGGQMFARKAESQLQRSWQECFPGSGPFDHNEIAHQSAFLSKVFDWKAGYLTSQPYQAGDYDDTPDHSVALWPFLGTGILFGQTLTTAGNDLAGAAVLQSQHASAFGYGGETDGVPRNGDPSDYSQVMLAPVTAFGQFADQRWADGISFTGRPHGGGIFATNSLFFSSALDNPAVGAGERTGSVVSNVLSRFAKPVPGAPGDVTSNVGGQPDFYADFYCHAPFGDPYAGGTWVAAMTPAGAVAVPSNGAAWSSSWCGQASDIIGWADFDGNRTSDSYCYHSSAGTVDVALSTGTGFATPSRWTSDWWCSGVGASTVAGDVTGDGEADLVCSNHNYWGTVYVAASTGTGFGQTNSWATNVVTAGGALSPVRFCQVWDDLFGVSDMDGDGVADIWCFDHTTGDTYVQLSRHGAFVDPYHPSYLPWIANWCAAPLSLIDFGVADVNGDSFGDLYCHNTSNGNVYSAFGRGEVLPAGREPPLQLVGGFRALHNVNDLIGYPIGAFCTSSQGRFGVGDFNGDGRSDFFCHQGWYTSVSVATIGHTQGAEGTACSANSSAVADATWSLGAPTAVMTGWCGWSSALNFGSATGW